MALPWTPNEPPPPRCLWPGCDHEAFPVASLAYEHMTRCPHRPQETK